MSSQVGRVRLMSVIQFQERFGTSTQCEAHVAKLRWPEGFVCPHCQSHRACYLEKRRVYQCNDCRRQTSLTAGTIFHRARISLEKWFFAIYWLAHDKKGCPATLLAKLLDVCYPTAWLMGHKIRQAMTAGDRSLDLTGLIELDDAYLGGVRVDQPGRPGSDDDRHTPILAAVEVLPSGKPGKAVVKPMRNFRKTSVNRFVQAYLRPRCVVQTDHMKGFGDLASLGHTHQTPPRRRGKRVTWPLPKVHLLISNLKRFVLGRHHMIHGKHAQRYLGEFNYRFNRRREEPSLFESLIRSCLQTQTVTYPGLCMAERA